jgi:hypothetical protein
VSLQFVFVADCDECKLRKGFATREERADWSLEHKKQTGHLVDIEVEVWR